MEPAPFPRLLMDIFHIPFALLAAGESRQMVFGRVDGILRVQRGQRIDVFTHALLRQTQQAFHVRANIICLVGFCIQHQKDVVHVLGQLPEQLFAVQDFGILTAQLDAAPVNNQQNGHERKAACNAHDILDRSLPKLIHTGIDDIHGDKFYQDPVLDACTFVRQIVSCAAQRYLIVSAGAFCKIVGKALHLRLGEVGMLAQHCKQVIDVLLALRDLFDHDLSIWVDGIDVGSSAERRIAHGFHHIVVVTTDGNGIVGKSAVDALCFGADKHQRRLLPGQGCVHHNVVLIGKHLVKVALQTKIARFPARRHIVAVIRKKVKFGKAKLLLCGFQIHLNPVIVGVAVQKAVPQMQIGDVLVGDHGQHAVGFMHNFL